MCADNYFGNPESPGGSCRSCNCSNNIDVSRPGNCDIRTGECLQCLFNTEGFNCQMCKAGYYGDAVNQECKGNLKMRMFACKQTEMQEIAVSVMR